MAVGVGRAALVGVVGAVLAGVSDSSHPAALAVLVASSSTALAMPGARGRGLAVSVAAWFLPTPPTATGAENDSTGRLDP